MAPLWLLLAQIPEASFDLFELALAPWSELHPWTGNGFLLLILWLGTALSSSLTYLGVRAIGRGAQPNWSEAFAVLKRRWRPLGSATFLAVLAVFIGVLVIVPGIYFMALYLFVPFLALEGESNSGSVYLIRSKKLAKQALGVCLMVALAFFLSSVAFLLLERAPGLASLGTGVRIGIRLIFSIGIGALLNAGLSHLYLELKERSAL